MGLHFLNTSVALLVLAFGMTIQTHAQPSEGDLIISEIMYDAATTDSESEYVEVYNATSHSIPLDSLKLIAKDPEGEVEQTGGIFSDTEVESGDFAVLCVDDDKSKNGGVECAIDYADDVNLTNTSPRTVLLQRGDGTEIDSVQYDEDDEVWPDAGGASLEYVGGTDADNAKGKHWQAATERRGDFAETAGDSKGSPNVDAAAGTLPVELTAFRVSTIGERAIIEWETASETGNAGFAVQHRSTETEEWKRLDFVEGMGTTDQPTTYDVRTGALAAGRHVFRLQQIDRDGTVHYGPKEQVRMQSRSAVRLESPNPVRGGSSLAVVFGAEAALPADVRLYNIAGERVRTVTVERGAVRRKVSTHGLASGTYFLRVHTASRKIVRRISIIR